MAIQQNFPSSRPSLNLNFARSKKLDPRITFTRTSSATYVGEDGLIKIAPANAARFDHDPITGDSLGLLVEEQRTNLLLRSEEFETGWNVLNTIVTTNTVETAAPNGSFTADKLSGSSSSSNIKRISQVLSFSVVSYTFSVYAKADDQNFLQLRTFASAGDIFCNFDLSDGTVGDNVGVTSVGIQSLENGWYRCWIVFTPSSGSSSVSLNFITSLTSPNLQNTTLTTSLYLWGAQLEQGAFPTSYIPTTASTVTRTADNASMTGSNFSSFYNPNEGSIYVSIKYHPTLAGVPGVLWLNNNLSGFLGLAIRRVGSNIFDVLTRDFNGFLSTSQVVNPTLYPLTKIMATYNSLGHPRLSVNGSLTTENTGSTISIVANRLEIGYQAAGGAATTHLSGHISQLTYYPSRLTNTQIQTLTK